MRLLGIPFGSVNFIENFLNKRLLLNCKNKRSIGVDAKVGEYGKFIALNVSQLKKCARVS